MHTCNFMEFKDVEKQKKKAGYNVCNITHRKCKLKRNKERTLNNGLSLLVKDCSLFYSSLSSRPSRTPSWPSSSRCFRFRECLPRFVNNGMNFIIKEIFRQFIVSVAFNLDKIYIKKSWIIFIYYTFIKLELGKFMYKKKNLPLSIANYFEQVNVPQHGYNLCTRERVAPTSLVAHNSIYGER